MWCEMEGDFAGLEILRMPRCWFAGFLGCFDPVEACVPSLLAWMIINVDESARLHAIL